VPVPAPAVFFACPAVEHSGTQFSAAPFDRVHLGYEGLFGRDTLFYHVPPEPDSLAVQTLEVPVLDLRDAGNVEWGTVLAVVLGTAWILVVLWRGVLRNGIGGGKRKKIE
jgi:PIG-X/PBN1 protein